MKKITILGAGLAGLGAGIKLVGKDVNLTVLEKQNYVGGLATSFYFKQCFFDIGPHAFHAPNEEMLQFFLEVMNNDVYRIKKNVKISFQNKKLSYPIKPINMLLNLNFFTLFASVASFLKLMIFGDAKTNPGSLEELYVSLYGQKLYKLFFENYTSKVWGIHPQYLSNIFLKHRLPNKNLFQLAFQSMFSLFNPENKKFTKNNYVISQYYPRKGSGSFPKKLQDIIENKKGKVLLERTVQQINVKNNKVSSILVENSERKETFKTDICISTIPIDVLIKSINPLPPKNILESANRLQFRAILIACLLIKTDSIIESEYMYFHHQIFNRVGQMNYFSRESSPQGTSAITAEITRFPEDEIWEESDEKIISRVLNGMENEGYKIKDKYSDGFVIRLINGYPIPTLNYEEDLYTIFEYLNGIENLYSGGRQAMFTYIQMFQALAMGFEIADCINNSKTKPLFKKSIDTKFPVFV